MNPRAVANVLVTRVEVWIGIRWAGGMCGVGMPTELGWRFDMGAGNLESILLTIGVDVERWRSGGVGRPIGAPHVADRGVLLLSWIVALTLSMLSEGLTTMFQRREVVVGLVGCLHYPGSWPSRCR